MNLSNVQGHWFEHEDVIYIGKRDSHSFRVVELDREGVLHRVSYGEHPVDPIQLPRHERPSLRMETDSDPLRRQIVNDYTMDFANARLLWVLPLGQYEIENATIEFQQVSQDGRHVLLSLRFDLPSHTTLVLNASPKKVR